MKLVILALSVFISASSWADVECQYYRLKGVGVEGDHFRKIIVLEKAEESEPLFQVIGSASVDGEGRAVLELPGAKVEIFAKIFRPVTRRENDPLKFIEYRATFDDGTRLMGSGERQVSFEYTHKKSKSGYFVSCEYSR